MKSSRHVSPSEPQPLTQQKPAASPASPAGPVAGAAPVAGEAAASRAHRTPRPVTGGAHRAAPGRGPASRPVGSTATSAGAAPGRPDEPCLDGLFTYCLSVLCDHEQATSALRETLALADRRSNRGPEQPEDRRAWFYALARWCCLRHLAEARRTRQGSHTSHRRTDEGRGRGRTVGRRRAAGASNSGGPTGDPVVPAACEASGHVVTAREVPPYEGPEGLLAQEAVAHGRAGDAVAELRRSELALLAWPEAAGTSPEQREALELSARHGLSAHEVAAVLGRSRPVTRELIASAGAEVERTRSALAVVERGTCPSVTRLTGDQQLLFGAALRRELVRHVDDCPQCRSTARRAAIGLRPGGPAAAQLPLVPAPRAALRVPLPRPRGRTGLALAGGYAMRGAPRFDRRGFPMDPKDRAARRDRMRARALTTTVVATVVAAPVFALWAAYRSAPLTGEADGGVTAVDGGRGTSGGAAYENAGNARATGTPERGGRTASPDVSVEVVSEGAAPSDSGTGPGRLTVDAEQSGRLTLITLRASGGESLRWSASTGASWLVLDRTSGTLGPGESVTLRVRVDRTREPAGRWRAVVSFAPSGAIVSVRGSGTSRPTPSRPGTPSHPSEPSPSDPSPSDPGPSEPGTPAPTDPTTPPPSTPGGPSPSDPGPSPSPSDPNPSPSGSGPGIPQGETPTGPGSM